MIDVPYPDQALVFTEDELVALSDIIRRVFGALGINWQFETETWKLFTRSLEIDANQHARSALAKIEHAKSACYAEHVAAIEALAANPAQNP